MSDQFLTLTDLRGGRTGIHHMSLSGRDDQVAEAVNVDYYYSKCGNKRWGSASLSLAGYSAQTSRDGSLFRHIPAGDPTAAELFAFNSDTTSAGDQVERLAGAVIWFPVTAVDALRRSGIAEVRCADLNGKMFACYKANSTVDRLHVYDGFTLRRVGIAPGANVPTNTKAGGATTDSRKYKVAWTKQSGGVTVYRSELTGFGAVSTTAAEDTTVTRPTLPGEGETHWELYAYSVIDSYATGYLIATVAAATTTSIDSNVTLAGNAPAEPGLNEVPTSWKYIMVHGNRLLGAGSHETGGKNNRVWYTSPLGTLNVGDDERIPNTLVQRNFTDLNENDGGAITGFGGVINGTPIVFKYNGTFKLVPTGLIAQPYQTAPIPISETIGCIRQETVVRAEDENGNACVYWMSAQGVYRYGNKGLEYCGYDIEDIWYDAAYGTRAPAHGIFHADKKQIWWWIGDSTNSNSIPNHKIVFHTQNGKSTAEGVKGGWVRHTGPSALAYCSVMFSETVGVSMSLTLKPYISYGGGSVPALFKCDVTGVMVDAATYPLSYVTTKAYALAGLGNLCEGIEPVLLMRLLSPLTLANTIGVDVIKNFGEATVTDTIKSITGGSQFQFWRLFASMTDAAVVQLTYGDAGSVNTGGDFWYGVEAIMLQVNNAGRL